MATTLGDILDYINKRTEVQARIYTGNTKLYPYFEFEYFSGLGLDCFVTFVSKNVEAIDWNLKN